MVKQQDPILDIGGIKVQIGTAISQGCGSFVATDPGVITDNSKSTMEVGRWSDK